jgi:hypothetical protein
MILKITEIKPNPVNPRIIKGDNFKKLVESIKQFPEMLDIREIVINKDHVILGGNMRFKAAKAAGMTELPVKIVDWSEDKQREFIIKDNVSGGEWDWDLLANEWDTSELDEWGLELPASVNESKEWEDIDDFDVADNSLKIVIQFESENDRQQFNDTYKLQIRTKGKTTWSTWFPYKERNDFSDVKLQ